MSMDYGAPQLTDEDEPGQYRLINLLSRLFYDVNARIWRKQTDDRARVLQSFRSPDDRGYSRRFAWLTMALLAVDVRRKARLDFDVIERLTNTDVPRLAELAALARKRSRSQREIREPALVDEEVADEFEAHEDAARAWLARFAQKAEDLIKEAPTVAAALQAALPKSLASDFGADVDDVDLFAFELRRAGFEPWEILALCELGPQAQLRERDPLRFRDLTLDARAALRSKLNRLFERAGHRKPPRGGGIRGPMERAYDLLSIRTWSDTDDADTDRNPAAGATRERVPDSTRHVEALGPNEAPEEL